jgi:hypothetical protein
VYLALTGETRLLWDTRAGQPIYRTWYVQFALNWSFALADEQALIAAG